MPATELGPSPPLPPWSGHDGCTMDCPYCQHLRVGRGMRRPLRSFRKSCHTAFGVEPTFGILPRNLSLRSCSSLPPLPNPCLPPSHESARSRKMLIFAPAQTTKPLRLERSTLAPRSRFDSLPRLARPVVAADGTRSNPTAFFVTMARPPWNRIPIL